MSGVINGGNAGKAPPKHMEQELDVFEDALEYTGRPASRY